MKGIIIMSDDGSISSATDSIVGLLQQNGNTNNDLSSLSENATSVQTQDPVEQTTTEIEEPINEAQPDSEVAVIDETVEEVVEDSSELQEEDRPLETSDEELVEPTYTVKVQGETLDVNLDELKAGYQRESDYRRKTESLSIERQQHQEQVNNESTILEGKLTNLEKMTMMARRQLNLDAGDINELMQRDPVEGVRKKHQLEQRALQLQAQEQETQKLRNEEMKKYMKAEQQKMFLEIPEMREESSRTKFVANMRTYLTKMGFNQDEVNSVNDTRYVKLIKDGMKWQNLEASRPALNKKVQGTPKVVRGGVTSTKSQRQQKVNADKMSKLKQSGSIDDATQVLKDIFG
jgi:hypothetical protein